MTEGYIFNIQRFSIHDGPGIRTTVFLKGCPLKCWWCHNPEGQFLDRELLVFKNRCIGCGNCVKVCEREALSIKDGKVVLDREKCNLCGKCVENCTTRGLEFAGKLVTDEWLFKEVKKDIIFFDQSGGGVTISGGEPLMQFEFLLSMVKLLNKEGIHVTVDTSGYGEWDKFKQLVEYVDLFLYDIKLIDDEKHKKYMGVSNEIILKNMQKLVNEKTKIAPRIPLIPGVNDDIEDIKQFAEFLASLGFREVNILPYHDFGREKYIRTGKEYKIQEKLILSEDKKTIVAEQFLKKGINIILGGGLSK
ncbi:glycyl-radical enzyme activating protein [Anaerosalibacter sp. Marseille-P3206]|uniref:glycyl-radical enzyme activating protein n=1 Tax=Anaerosalibacter sp. Marseille-P3206 TaxID=1871005 RepID=UPI002100B0C5|nr:glycyl-radical enzyme activating protein [Anaerosalibacter sp. Marseille-P3206]